MMQEIRQTSIDSPVFISTYCCPPAHFQLRRAKLQVGLGYCKHRRAEHIVLEWKGLQMFQNLDLQTQHKKKETPPSNLGHLAVSLKLKFFLGRVSQLSEKWDPGATPADAHIWSKSHIHTKVACPFPANAVNST